ncbi:hypothetical protein F0562_005602 [Nyssa sinensis]|uniref:Uncharacterized protein n=1 Tax=Nyssa sinensis TaxID=561372 RepID=A0A5J5AL75_9ASTE|nr:hypothetical protein F0562_005602 [Nyssa sinensis]
MGRTKSVWGNDCLEFKPERWVPEKGGIKIEPSKKFLVFSSGPRSCPGKELSFLRMNAIAAAIIHNYHLQLAEGHPVTPAISIILHMKHGLKRWRWGWRRSSDGGGSETADKTVINGVVSEAVDYAVVEISRKEDFDLLLIEGIRSSRPGEKSRWVRLDVFGATVRSWCSGSGQLRLGEEKRKKPEGVWSDIRSSSSIQLSDFIPQLKMLDWCLGARRVRQLQKILWNGKLTIFCLFLTVIVLRGNLSAGKFETPQQDFEEIRERFYYCKCTEPRRVLVKAQTTTTAAESASNNNYATFDQYEGMMKNFHPGLGDHQWPLVTHFVGCKPCGKFGDYPVERCLKQMDRAFNFGDNQILQMYGVTHKSLE